MSNLLESLYSYEFRFTLFLVGVQCDDYIVEIKNNGPVVKGASIRFTATLFEGNKLASGTFSYHWKDNALPPHKQTVNKSYFHI